MDKDRSSRTEVNITPVSTDGDTPAGPTRRNFLKGAIATGIAASVGPWPLTYARGTEQSLTWLAYPGHATEEVVGAFQKEFGVEIKSQEFSAGERMLALINSSPPGTFDLVMAGTPYINILAQQGMLEPLNASDYPMEDFYKEFREWPGLSLKGTPYSIPTTWGYNGLAYNSDLYTQEDMDSYSIMWDERLVGRLGMRDWYLPVMGVFSAYQGNKNPYDISDSELDAVVDSMNEVAGSVTGFYGFSGVFSALADGTAHVIPGCGDWITGLLQRDGHPIRSFAPKEGAISWMESNSIVGKSQNKKLAKDFIRYLSSPEGQIRTIVKSSYMAAGVNRKAWERLNEEMPKEAEMVSMKLDSYNILDMLREGRIKYRTLPKQQSMQVWQEAYSRFQKPT